VKRLRGIVVPALALVAVATVARAQAESDGFDLSSLQIPPGFLDLSDIEMVGVEGGGFTATATTTLANARTQVLLSMSRDQNGQRHVILGLQPEDWSLAQSIPALANLPGLSDVTLSNVGLVLADQAEQEPAAAMPDVERRFFAGIYHSDAFTLVLTPGINLIATIPTAGLPDDSPLRKVMDALGITQGDILLQGTLGKSLALLKGGATADALKDLYLRAELPPMRPPGSPQWFRSGQLALEITGQPSIRLVGTMDVTIDNAELQFFLAALLARTGISLAGGMQAPQPWVAPFGIGWLTLKQVILEIGITPTGSLDLGFAGAAIVGQKDIDVAVSIALSEVGVPDNFMMRGRSDSGVGLSDLAELQARMAAARQAASGASGPGAGATLIPISALPDVEIKSLDLQFAPKPDPVLGIQRGFRIAGRLWLPTGPGGSLENFAGVDANVSDSGVWVRGDMDAWQLGPLAFDDAKLDLTATPQDQHLIVHGRVQLGSSSQLVDLAITRDSLRFVTETQLFNLFHATLEARAAFQLRNPSFVVDGVVSNDFGTYLQPVLREGILRFASTGKAVVAGAQDAADAATTALDAASATADQLRATLQQLRDGAAAALTKAQQQAAAALAAVEAAASSRDAARSLWAGTPSRRVALRAARHADYVRWVATYDARVTAYLGAQSVARARQAILDAIPPVDQNALLLSAEAGVADLRQKLETAEQNLNALSTHFDQVVAAAQSGVDLFSVQSAEFHADLALVQGGGAMSWLVRGTFVGQPFELQRSLDFGSPAQAAADLLAGLLQT